MSTIILLLLSCTGKKIDTGDSAQVEPSSPSSPTSEPTECEELPAQAEAILAQYCATCHKAGDPQNGGMDYVLNVSELVANNKLTPGNADESRILIRMEDDSMPPSYATAFPSDEEIQVVRDWIECGAEDFNQSEGERTFIPNSDVFDIVLADLNSLSSSEQENIRYLSLVHLYNGGVSLDTIEMYRKGISKLMNSMSWEEEIIRPEMIGDKELLLRIDLRDYAWESREKTPVSKWEIMLKQYPYSQQDHLTYSSNFDQDFVDIQDKTTSRIPIVFADWFVQGVALPPLYHEILELPTTNPGFLDKFGLDLPSAMEEDDVLRAGFNLSGVSANNRLIERHELSAYEGYCWVSYDFGVVDDPAKNLFNSPLDFEAEGGEVICSLPNGLQAYYLTDGIGHRLDSGPIEVVAHRTRDNSAVDNGVDCMDCHYAGIIPKQDMIRDYVEQNEEDFSSEDLMEIYRLYPGNTEVEAAQEDDIDFFTSKLTQTGIAAGEVDPTYPLMEEWRAQMDNQRVAAEMGLTKEEFIELISVELPEELEDIKTMATDGQLIDRSVYVDLASALLCYINTGSVDCVEAFSCGRSSVSCLAGQDCIPSGQHEGSCVASDDASFEGYNYSTCGDEVDNDGDGLEDCEEADCYESPSCSADELLVPEDCSDGIDNDLDGAIDCEDFQCSGSTSCICIDDCILENNGECDDGGVGSSSSFCDYGTDCVDCGLRPACDNSCSSANDGVCDDGGPNDDWNQNNDCERGTDCADCGAY